MAMDDAVYKVNPDNPYPKVAVESIYAAVRKFRGFKNDFDVLVSDLSRHSILMQRGMLKVLKRHAEYLILDGCGILYWGARLYPGSLNLVFGPCALNKCKCCR